MLDSQTEVLADTPHHSRIVNVAVGALMIFGAIAQFVTSFAVQNVIVGVYVIIFGLGEPRHPAPRGNYMD